MHRLVPAVGGVQVQVEMSGLVTSFPQFDFAGLHIY